MKELKDMTREELLEVIKVKNALINELRGEIEIYQELALELQKKASNKC